MSVRSPPNGGPRGSDGRYELAVSEPSVTKARVVYERLLNAIAPAMARPLSLPFGMTTAAAPEAA